MKSGPISFFMPVALMSLCLTVNAQSDDAARRRNFNTENDVAIREFDPVSFFKNKPVKGTSQFRHHHRGITYYFSSAANLEEFKKSPHKYEPAYGGWCAYTVATTGDRIKINPSSYKIIDGKLYLFSNFNGNNTLLRWNKEEKKLKASADKNWLKKMH
ncbi:MAG: YHS domain-containing (seleno)protein [Bacteroidota bacterium]